MNDKLTVALIENNLLNRDTELTVTYMVYTIGLTFKVPSIGTFILKKYGKNKDGFLVFSGVNTVDGSTTSFKSSDITKIDGMEPERFASFYGIKPDGDKVKVGKKRGRKCKGLVINE